MSSFGKSLDWAKMTKNGQKWPKNMVFGLLENHVISVV